ncbi:hypothetical protein BBK36DRAFT_1096975, partial [Trichoderma citrinoviride]
MCGTGRYDAKPSILVSHPWNDMKTGLSIMKILSEPQVREQYDSSPMEVRFKIYLFLGPSFKYLGWPIESLDIRLKDNFLSGAVLVSDDACNVISTITCGVRHTGPSHPVFALTPAHAFEPSYKGDGGVVENVKANADASDRDGEGVEDEAVCEFADVEYDIAELLQYESSNVLEPRLSEPPTDRARDQDLTKFGTKILKPKGVWGRPKLPEWPASSELRDWHNHPNLDWALVEIENSDQWSRPNLDYELRPVDHLSEEKEPVDIMTSRGLLHGTISSTPTFIANARHSGSLCEVWIVSTMDSSFDVGDSGALVIRPGSQSAYGYVIAVNHSRELYIVPLRAALNQICHVLSI